MIVVFMNLVNENNKHKKLIIKTGKKRHGEEAIKALIKEYSKFDEAIFLNLKIYSLTDIEKSGALNILTKLKEQRCCTLKVRVCTDGRKQRKYITKEAAISTTIQMTSLMLSLLIDAEEGRDVATANVVGVNLMTDMKDKVIVKLTGDAVDICVK